MKKPDVFRLYNFPDANLVTIGKEKATYMQRDKAKFEAFGITLSHISEFVSGLETFSDNVTDIEAVSDQTGITAAKDALGEELRVAIREIMARVSLKFGVDSAKYRKFGTDGLSRQSDADLLITASRVVRVGTELLPDLTANGVTAEMLAQVTTLRSNFDDSIVDMKMAIGDRDILQEDRVEAGNLLYEKLVHYADTGKTIWETSDVARYNDYVLYNTPSGEAPAPPIS